MLIEQKTLKQLIKNKSNVDVNKVKDILQLDPTLNVNIISDDTEIGKYGEWLLGKLYKKYDQLTTEKKNTIKSDLQFYDYQVRSKRIPPEYDNIYKIKSIEELNDIVISLQKNDNPLTQDPVTVAIGNHKFKTVSENPFELLKRQYYDDIKEGGVTKWLVFNPKTKEESIGAGHDTKWCTSRDDSKNQWNAYIKEEITAWIFLLSGKYKINNPDEFEKLTNNQLHKICIIVEQGQCQNRINEIFKLKEIPEIGRFIEDRINDNTITLNYSMLDILDSIKYITSGFNNKKNGLVVLTQYYEDELEPIIPTLTEKDQLILMRQYPHLLQFMPLNIMKKQNIQLQQVSQNGYQIKHIIDAGIKPEHDVQLQQVTHDYYQIKYIINAGVQPEHDVQLQQVSQDGDQIKYIINAGVQPEDDNKWHDIQLQQVSNCGYQIKYIIDAGIKPEHDIQLQQVTRYGNQIYYIIDAGIRPEYNIQLQQISQNGYQIRHIKNPSEKIQLQQIKQYVTQYKHIENPTPKQTQLYKQLTGVTESTGYISKLLDVN